MSYVLDALQRAEAERKSASAPGMHNAPAAAQSPAAITGQRNVRRWLAAAAALIAVLVAGVALGSKWFARPDVPAGVPVVVSAPISAPPAVSTPATPASTLPSPAAPASTLPSPAAPVSVSAQEALPAAPKRDVAQRPVRQAATASQPAAATVIATAPAPKPPDAAEPAAPKPLSAELRQQLPALKLGGASYSDNPAMRLLIVNGQVWTEGSSLTPELKLDRIGPASAVFNFKGQPFEMRY